MAGKKKIGLDYFAHDTDAFQDIKVRKLIKRKGGGAYTVYVCLLCIIYRQGYYLQWDDELPFIVCEQTGVDEEFCHDVIQVCLSIGLFDQKMYKRHKVLTSSRIQESYKFYCKQAKRIVTIDKYSLISSKEKAISSEDKAVSSEDMGISSKKSGKHDPKRIEGKRKELPPPPKSPSPLTGSGGEDVGKDLLPEQKEASAQPQPQQRNDIPQPPSQQQTGGTYFPVIASLKGKIGIDDAQYEDDLIWECMRLTNNGRTDSVGVQLIKMWLEQTEEERKKPGNGFWFLVQNLQKMEKEGTIRCEMTHKEYFMYRWLRVNLGRNDYQQVCALCKGSLSMQAVCQDCIREIKTSDGKIKMPGKFILSRLSDPIVKPKRS